MENDQAVGTAGSPVSPQSTGVTPPVPQVGGISNIPAPTAQHPHMKLSPSKRWMWIILGIVALLMIIGGAFVVLNTPQSSSNVLPLQTGKYDTIQLPLSDLRDLNVLNSDSAKSLKVNGQLSLSGSLMISPAPQPANPLRGQLYFDQTSNRLRYYNGTQFVDVGSSTNTTNTTNNITNTTNTTNVTNIFNQSGGGTPAPSVQLQATAPGVQQAGSFNVSGIGQVGSLRTGTISNDTSVSLSTDNDSGATGNISIKTGDSSTTASGNIEIDAGVGIIDGEIVENKTFESGLDNMEVWFDSTIAQTSTQARTGTHSLEMTATSAFWGVIEQLPGTPVIPGHQYHFSIWTRAATTPRNILARVVWHGADTTTSMAPVVNTTTGWTEMTMTGAAPAGATSVSFEIQSTGTAGEIHYFDDIVITDLSSGSAVSSIEIGATNAKIITIGNLNQIGATTIRGSSGINLQSGVSGINMTGGAIMMTGSAASTLSTSQGALTLTSAATATWGISTASSGVGGNLTLRAGGGGADGVNAGGDLVLQGGNGNAGGAIGSVIVRPPADSTDAFMIQNSGSNPLFTADTSDMRIVISGSGGTFGNLVLADSHFSSTQTTAPKISVPADCGTDPSAAVAPGSTDSAGSFTITTGLGGTSDACDTTITFNHAYGAAPKSIIVVGKDDANSVARQVYVSNSTASTFTVRFSVSAGGANNTMYSYNYWIVE